jgi:hypothetical protein
VPHPDGCQCDEVCWPEFLEFLNAPFDPQETAQEEEEAITDQYHLMIGAQR